MKPKFSEDEIKFVSFFLTKDNTPAFKREIKEGTGLSKTAIKDLCDKFEGELLIKSYDYVPKSGYLVHYSLKESFSAFSCIAQNLLPQENFLKSSYTQKMFNKFGYSRLFKKLGVEQIGPFEFYHKEFLRIARDYGSLRKKIFAYLLFFSGTYEEISNSLHPPKRPALQLRAVLEDMKKEKILTYTRWIYGINPEFVIENLKYYPEIQTFIRGKKLEKLADTVNNEFKEYLKRKTC